MSAAKSISSCMALLMAVAVGDVACVTPFVAVFGGSLMDHPITVAESVGNQSRKFCPPVSGLVPSV